MSNRQPEENESQLNSIAYAVEQIRDRMITKDDAKRFAVKDDLERFATKEDFVSLREQVSFLGGQVEDIRDRMATKDELAKVEARLNEKIGVETTTIRGDLEQVHLRLDGIEKAVSSKMDHVEAEMSRMRSVLYLLVKDRPDMLRLLGQSPPAGG